MMKTILAVLVFASPLFAQEPAPAASVRGGCGPSEAYFDVKTDRKQHPVAPADAGKALVYVFEDIERGPTMRVGLDGAWIGANKGKSYFFFSVDPGEAGKVYYLRTQVYERTERDLNVKFEPVEAAEGQFLISASAFSTSHPKK